MTQTLTFEQKTAKVVEAMTQQLREEVPELCSVVVVLGWQKHLQEAAIPFIWGGLSKETDNGLTPKTIMDIGHALQQLLQYRREVLQAFDRQLAARINDLQNQLTLMESEQTHGESHARQRQPDAATQESQDVDGDSKGARD